MMMNLQVGQGSGPGGGGDGSGGGGGAWRPRALRHLLGVSGALRAGVAVLRQYTVPDGWWWVRRVTPEYLSDV